MATLKELQTAGTFPKHLAPNWFDQDAPVPPAMADDTNWTNNGMLLDAPVFVRYNGAVRPCTNLIYLDQWLHDGGQIVPKPQPAA